MKIYCHCFVVFFYNFNRYYNLLLYIYYSKNRTKNKLKLELSLNGMNTPNPRIVTGINSIIYQMGKTLEPLGKVSRKVNHPFVPIEISKIDLMLKICIIY